MAGLLRFQHQYPAAVLFSSVVSAAFAQRIVMVLGIVVAALISKGESNYDARGLIARCPQKCLCSPSQKTTDCREKGLLNIPDALPRSTESLHFDINAIKTIKFPAQLFRLNILTLSWNNISRIGKDDFINLPKLRILKLDHNNIAYIDGIEWTHNVNLNVLDLSFNHLVRVSTRIFFQLAHLQSIDLSHNLLEELTLPVTPLYRQHPPLASRLTLNLTTNRLNSSTAEAIKLLHSILYCLDISNQPRFNFSSIKAYLRAMKQSKIVRLTLRQFRLFYLPDFIFQDAFLPQARFLDLSDNIISHLEDHALDTMEELTSLLLSHNMLSSNPDLRLQQRLEYLDLSFNQIAVIRKELFPRSLKVLHLSGNLLSVVTTDVFSSLYFLQTLTLSKCKMKRFILTRNTLMDLRNLDVSFNHLYRRYIKPIFEQLRDLTRLDISGNRLDNLWANFTSGHRRLQILNVSRNNIPQLHEIDLGAENLQELDLSWNRINILFDYSSIRLKRLHLQHNQISNIDRLAFRKTRNLDFLDLSNNPMRARVVSLWRHVLARLGPRLRVLRMNSFEIFTYLNNNDWKFFHPFQRLEELSLRNCSILSLPASFSALPASLRRLDLAENQLTIIKPFTFAAKVKANLRELDISGNKLFEIDPTVFAHLAHLHRLSVAGNRIICDCPRLPAFLDWARRTNATIPGLFTGRVVCFHPADRYLQPVIGMDTSQCSAYMDHTPLAAGLTAAFVFLFVASIPYVLGYLIERRRKEKGTLSPAMMGAGIGLDGSAGCGGVFSLESSSLDKSGGPGSFLGDHGREPPYSLETHEL